MAAGAIAEGRNAVGDLRSPASRNDLAGALKAVGGELASDNNLKTGRAYLLKEAFQQLWEYNSPAWADKFLDEWYQQSMRSRIEPIKKIARSLRQHRELLLSHLPSPRTCPLSLARQAYLSRN
jgi:hypothetical protein